LGSLMLHLVLESGVHAVGQEVDRRAAVENIERQAEVYSTKHVAELLNLCDAAADAELAKWADESVFRAWIPEKRVVLVEDDYAMPGSPEMFRGMPDHGVPGILNLVCQQEAQPSLFIHFGAEVRRVKWTGEVVEIDFIVQRGPAEKLNVSSRTKWTARFSMDEVLTLFQQKTPGQALAEMMSDKRDANAPAAYLTDWLRRAGALGQESK
jgi:hypothetical protein